MKRSAEEEKARSTGGEECEYLIYDLFLESGTENGLELMAKSRIDQTASAAYI